MAFGDEESVGWEMDVRGMNSTSIVSRLCGDPGFESRFVGITTTACRVFVAVHSAGGAAAAAAHAESAEHLLEGFTKVREVERLKVATDASGRAYVRIRIVLPMPSRK